ncbi:MAG: bifunctional diguanylate cyclase/phosphodiesterase [Micromonosporaceae bacterium]|nr:bifunctional diguanylate cyclase/phosphodiesterase [Micromonosporaceae bacterium]
MGGEVISGSYDDKTNRRLRLLVGLVVVCAALVFGAAVSEAPRTQRHLAAAVLFTALIAVAQSLRIRLRFGADYIVLSPMSAAALVSTTFLPASWAIVATGGGMIINTLASQQRPIKIGFNVGKEILAVGAAAWSCALVGIPPAFDGVATPLSGRVLGLAAAAIGYALADEFLSVLLFSLITQMPVRQRILIHLDMGIISRLVSFLIVFVALWAYDLQPWFVAVLPFLVYAMHLASANQLRSRTERRAWQRLAQATDELNTVDLDIVVQTAIRRAAELFSADEIDLNITVPPAPARLVRGTRAGIVFDGAAATAPQGGGYVITALTDAGHEADAGTLTLRFCNPIGFSERELYTLRSFATAINTAVRNAAAFAEARRLVARHQRAAHEDPLTGLANRIMLRAYTADLLETIAAPETLALLLIDLDHFKEVNETLGHAAGDTLLVEVAQRLQKVAGQGDLVARLGGDEFAVLLVGPFPPAGPVRRALEILAVLDTPVELDGMSIGIEASGGIATPPVTRCVDELLRRADVAMYQAKRKGQRVAAYTRSSDTASIGSLSLGGDLARAIAERQFILDFQPIVDLGSGEAIAAEALARWQHPGRGCLRPDQFLDGIERSGQLPGFAEIVLDQALTAVREWQAGGFPMDVAVNVSPKSLLDPDFPAAVQTMLARHDVPAETLVIELTESVTISQNNVVDEVLGALRSAGVRLALDDFGTGFSSLSTVTRIPVYELKIDRSFVSNMDSPAAAAVVRSTIELARSLDLLVVAEGVETEDQRRRLWELGCPAGQGYLFARPMATQRLLSRLGRGVGGQPGHLVAPINTDASVVRMLSTRRTRGDQQRFDRSG